MKTSVLGPPRRHKDDRKENHNCQFIQEGAKNYLQMVQNIQLTGFVPKMPRIDNPVIRFTKEDARSLHHLHYDALVLAYE